LAVASHLGSRKTYHICISLSVSNSVSSALWNSLRHKGLNCSEPVLPCHHHRVSFLLHHQDLKYVRLSSSATLKGHTWVGCITGIPWVPIFITAPITADTVPIEETGINPYITYTVSHINCTIIRCCIITVVLLVPAVKFYILLQKLHCFW